MNEHDWARHGYFKRPKVFVKDQGCARIKDEDRAVDAVHSGPIAGFARPLPVKVVEYPEPDWIEIDGELVDNIW